MSARLATYATSRAFNKMLFKADGTTAAASADWTPASGDVKVSIDGGTAANITTLPTAVTMGGIAYWRFTLSVAELTGKEIAVVVDDAAIADDGFTVETTGHASAMWPSITVDANVVTMAADSMSASALSSGAVAEVSSAVRDEVGLHHSGTVAAAASTTVTLQAGASAVDGTYVGSVICILSGVGENQQRLITAYTGSTRVATVAAWTTTPTAASTYVIVNG